MTKKRWFGVVVQTEYREINAGETGVSIATEELSRVRSALSRANAVSTFGRVEQFLNLRS